MPLIELQNLSFTYPKQDTAALKAINLSLHFGEAVGLLGRNGAGKTTLLSLICGLIQPSQGKLICKQGLKVGLVPQSLAFYGQLSVKENLEFFTQLYNLDSEIAGKKQLAALAARVNLDSQLNSLAKNLSGGQQRRLNFILGILQPADIYLLDEPSVGVDAVAREALMLEIEQLTQQGKSVILTSHYLEEIARVAQRVLLLEDGVLVKDLAKDPATATYGGKSLEEIYLHRQQG